MPALLASLLGFANVGAKDEAAGYFRGFPSYWNIAVGIAGANEVEAVVLETDGSLSVVRHGDIEGASTLQGLKELVPPESRSHTDASRLQSPWHAFVAIKGGRWCVNWSTSPSPWHRWACS